MHHDMAAWVDRGDLGPARTEQDRAGRHLRRAGLSGQIEAGLGIAAGLQQAVGIVGEQLDPEGARLRDRPRSTGPRPLR